jgi:hypothetical protein
MNRTSFIMYRPAAVGLLPVGTGGDGWGPPWDDFHQGVPSVTAHYPTQFVARRPRSTRSGGASRVGGSGSDDFLDSTGCRADVLSGGPLYRRFPESCVALPGTRYLQQKKEPDVMKRMLWTLSTITLLVGLPGCCWPGRPGIPGCPIGSGRSCAQGYLGHGSGGAEPCQLGGEALAATGGEPSGQVGPENCGGTGCEPCGGIGCQGCGPLACAAGGRARAAAGGFLGCFGRARRPAEPFTPGPPTGTVAYPYYTNRGPRDFLAENPPSIGP